MRQKRTALLLAVCLLCGLFAFAPVSAAAEYDGIVDVDLLVTAGIQTFAAHEGNYDSVVLSDVGAVGMGILGWRGPRALVLLQMICQSAPELSLELLGEELYTEITTTTDLTAWNDRVFTPEEGERTKALLGTEYGIAAEDALASNDIQLYIGYAWRAGIRSEPAILYYCSIENHYGHGGATVFMRYIRETLGITEQDTINSLDELHAAVIAAAENYSYVNSTLAYRTKIYNYIKNVLGWDTAPQIPVCPNCPSAAFADVPEKSNWAHDGIDFVVQNGYFNGTSATTFDPAAGMTRAMLVSVLYRVAGMPATEEPTQFTDVRAGSYYEQAVCWAAAHGIINGVDEMHFAPDQPITREQLAAILYRYANSVGTAAPGDPLLYLSYGDAPEASAYATAALSWCVELGLIRGTATNGMLLLAPKAGATRAQVAVILMRYLTHE